MPPVQASVEQPVERLERLRVSLLRAPARAAAAVRVERADSAVAGAVRPERRIGNGNAGPAGQRRSGWRVHDQRDGHHGDRNQGDASGDPRALRGHDAWYSGERQILSESTDRKVGSHKGHKDDLATKDKRQGAFSATERLEAVRRAARRAASGGDVIPTSTGTKTSGSGMRSRLSWFEHTSPHVGLLCGRRAERPRLCGLCDLCGPTVFVLFVAIVRCAPMTTPPSVRTTSSRGSFSTSAMHWRRLSGSSSAKLSSSTTSRRPGEAPSP